MSHHPGTPLDLPALPAPDPVSGNAPDVWNVAVAGKWLLITGLLVGSAVGQALYLKLGPAYEATARILVSKRTTAAIKDGENENSTLGDRAEHIALIMSPLIVGEAVKLGELDKLPSLEGDPDPVETILDDLKAKRSAGSDRSVLNVLDLTYTSGDKGDATKIVQAVIDAYKNYLDSTREENATESIRLIGEASTNLAKELHDKEAEYEKFREQAPWYWRSPPDGEGAVGDTNNVYQERLLAIEEQRKLNLIKQAELTSRIKAIGEAQQRGDSRAALEMLVRRFIYLDGGGLAGADGDIAGQIGHMRSLLLPLIIEERRLTQDFGPAHPQVQTVRRSMQSIREFYAKQGVVMPENKRGTVDPVDIVTIYVDSVHQQLAELSIRDKELEKLFEEGTERSREFAHFQVADQVRNGEIRRLKTLWEAVVARFNEISLSKENHGYKLRQVSPPRESVSLKRHLRFVGVLGAVGLIGAFAFCYLRTWQDKTFRTVEDVQKICGWPVVGQVPTFRTLDAHEIAATGAPFNPALYYFYRPNSPQAEAYRGLRTALFFSSLGEGHKVVQVTSSEPQDGKSTLAANLAMAMANSGKRVLLVDADLRCPTLHTLLGISQKIGVSDVLAGEIELENAIQETQVGNLSVLCAGLTPTNPSEVLGSPPFGRMMAHLRQTYDFVVVDTPPVLAVSDPCVVAAQSDALLVVIRLAKNKRASVKRTQEILATNGIPVLGLVVNGTPEPLESKYNYAYGESTPYNTAEMYQTAET